MNWGARGRACSGEVESCAAGRCGAGALTAGGALLLDEDGQEGGHHHGVCGRFGGRPEGDKAAMNCKPRRTRRGLMKARLQAEFSAAHTHERTEERPDCGDDHDALL